MLLGISFLTFLIVQLAPGDPAVLDASLQARVDPSYIQRMREMYGLNDPLWVQYGKWLARFCTLDFGESFKDQRPVVEVILERLPATLLLSGTSLLCLFLIAVPLGIVAAVYQNRWWDRFITLFTFLGYALPSFWLALVLMLIFGVYLDWFPISGMTSPFSEHWPWWRRLADTLHHLALPLFVTTFGGLASVSRYARTAMLEVIRQDYIRTARAKGLPETQVIFKHALRNALLPVITLVGLAFPALIGGSFLIETIFAWPGMGRLGYEAALSHNYPLIMGIGVFSSVLTLLGNLLADVGYAWADPRIRYGKH